MTQPGDDGPLSSEIFSGLWEPLSEDQFSRILDAAMDPLAAPRDLSVIPDEDEELVSGGPADAEDGDMFSGSSEETEDAGDDGEMSEDVLDDDMAGPDDVLDDPSDTAEGDGL
ncbi:hypothetical protein [Corynebacterium neomassiliense]|uniref:hypothetical protein n=1 Tax=Corynebacterium neomassiliense TaxID=2079482 RepID=UPI00102FB7B0|nr:hypothetical protein [Corynebacterium neomassiliense]